ncbi:MAG: hypothetical protein ABIP54_00605 [Candidatus Andersenbacteria bacterium]
MGRIHFILFLSALGFLALTAATPTFVQAQLGSGAINNPKPAPGSVIDSSSCSDSTFGCFEVGLPGSKTFSANQPISAFLDSKTPIKNLVNLFVTFVTGILVIVGVITIVIGGYMYMTAGGNASQVSSAKEMITAALIGIFIAFISVVILNTINPFLGKDAAEPTLGSPNPSSAIINDTSSGGSNTGSGSGANSSGNGSGTGNNTSTGSGSNSNPTDTTPSNPSGGTTYPLIAPETTKTTDTGVSILINKDKYYIRTASGDQPATISDITAKIKELPPGTSTTRPTVAIYRTTTSLPSPEQALQDAINAQIDPNNINLFWSNAQPLVAY